MTEAPSPLQTASTALFVPGHQPRRFARAASSGAGFVIFDLEDAVPADDKIDARQAVVAALTDPSTLPAVVRINAVGAGGETDAAALSACAQRLLGVMVPKAESVEELDVVDRLLGGATPLVPLIESVRGLGSLDALAAHPRVARLAFGAYDFAADVGSTASVISDHARILLILASRAADIVAPFESPVAEYRDLPVVREHAVHARDLGFGGMLCIHPGQVETAVAAFLPDPAEIEWAQRVEAAAGDGAGQVDGAMVDRPIRLRASAILARARAPHASLDGPRSTEGDTP